MKIIDDFLPEDEFKDIKDLMESPSFPWFFNDCKVHREDGDFQFTHTFLELTDGYIEDAVSQTSGWINIWDNVIKKIESKKCIRIKANLTLKTFEHRPSLYHIDYPNLKTAVFYVNNNNGYTEFENGVKIKSVANRICIFDSNLKHRGVSHTEGDQQRIVVNFNYER